MSRLFIFLAALTMLYAPAPVWAQTATATAVAEATVVRRLTFVLDEDLDFGQLLDGTTAGSVTISPSNVRTATGGVTLSPSTFNAARFSGYGSFNQRVQISINATPITIRRYVGSTPMPETMQVRDFLIGSTPTAVILTPTPRIFRIGSASGLFNFPVGATLDVGANQKSGKYIGSFTLTLNYL